MSEENRSTSFFVFETKRDYYPWIAVLVVVVAATISLSFQGRVWWCQAGDYMPWAWNIWSTHNSQHVLDPYSFTHVLHGILQFWLIGLFFRRVPMAWRFVIAMHAQQMLPPNEEAPVSPEPASEIPATPPAPTQQ